MNLILVKLIALFVLLIVLMKLKLKLAPAMAITIAVSLVLYGFGLNGSLTLLKNATFTWSTFSLVATVYSIFVIQGLLEQRGELKKVHLSRDALDKRHTKVQSHVPGRAVGAQTLNDISMCLRDNLDAGNTDQHQNDDYDQ